MLRRIVLALALLSLIGGVVMALSDVLVGQPALQVITPFTMGLPVLVAAGRLLDLRPARSEARDTAKPRCGPTPLDPYCSWSLLPRA